MRLSRLVKRMVAVADRFTTDLQVPVQHYPWIGIGTTYGEDLYPTTPIERLALVEMKQRLFRMPDGQEIMQRAVITFLRPIAPYGNITDRREPIDPRDKFVLPNGYTGPVKNIEGLETQLENSPYFAEVVLG